MKRINDVPYVCLFLSLFGCSGDPDNHPLSSTNTSQTPIADDALGLTTLSTSVGAAEIARRQTAVRSYFDARVASLHAVKTTQTSSGTTIDWVTPDKPQASPPPPLKPCTQLCAHTELQDEPAARGPAGTVPVVRFNVDAYLRSTAVPPLDPEDVLRGLRKGNGAAPPSPNAKGYYYAAWHHSATQVLGTSGVFYGGGAGLNTWVPVPAAPYLANSHSLSELSVYGGSGSGLQSVEVGQTQDASLNGGSTGTYLFTYYTTNDYTPPGGNNIGGYNQLVTGWHQVASDIVPGVQLYPSTTGGTQYEIEIETMQYQGNYWVWIDTEWIGYYPTSLFASSGIANSASDIKVYGEVDDPNAPTAVATGMGSGAFPSAGWAQAAFIRDLHYFADTNGSFVSFAAVSGDKTITDSNCYGMSAVQTDGSSGSCADTACIYSHFFNYFYYGGPGKGGSCQ